MALITESDITDRIGPITAEQSARVPGLIADADAEILTYCDRYAETATDQTVTLRAVGRRISLPRRPVTAVTTVVAVGVDGDVTVPVNDWHWDGIDKIDLRPGVGHAGYPLPAQGEGTDWLGANTYKVTYSYGAAVPAIITTVAVRIVARVLTSPTLAEGMTQETIGQYGYQLQQGMGSSGSTVRLTAGDKRSLHKWHTSSGTIVTPMR